MVSSCGRDLRKGCHFTGGWKIMKKILVVDDEFLIRYTGGRAEGQGI